MAQQEGVTNRIEFLGARSDVSELISESYIGIQSSNWEGFGLTAVELMAAGKPVIASDVDGLKQIVAGAGVIFNKGDIEDLAQKISRLLADTQYYKTIADACRQRALSYDISVMAESYRTIYYELADA